MLIAVLALGAVLAATTSEPPRPQLFDPSRDPQRDLWAAVDTAKAQHKRILLDVGGNWCGWCRLLDRSIADDKELSEFIATHFVVVRVNFSPDNTNTAFLSCFPEISGYPHFFVLHSDGTFLHSQSTDVLEAGKGYDRRRLLQFLRRWSH
jgi:thioredoxin-related protein